MRSTGLILAAGGIAAANEVLFAPVAKSVSEPGKIDSDAFVSRFNWRIVPATAVLALLVGGIEKASPEFATGIAGLTVLAVLIVPVGNAGTPLANISKGLGYQ